jgi:hypothetical protein
LLEDIATITLGFETISHVRQRNVDVEADDDARRCSRRHRLHPTDDYLIGRSSGLQNWRSRLGRFRERAPVQGRSDWDERYVPPKQASW